MNPLRFAASRHAAPAIVRRIVVVSAGLLALTRGAGAQALTGTIIVRVTTDSAPISGATIATRTASEVTDRSGLATFKLPTGQYVFRATSAGFRPESLSVFVGVGTTTVTIPVRRQTALPDVVIAPVERRPADAPTHVEVADPASIDEQIEQSPGVITDAVGRLRGVRVQPLSAGSAGAGIRIRGLPARYSKILMDGLPLLGDTPEGQDPLQISALGVDHVDVVPGVTSALYGTTALSGGVNVVSASPSSPSQVVVNGTTRAASDVAVWQTHTFSPQWAGTLLAGRHYRGESDPDGDGWAEVNGYKRVVVRPRAYWSRSAESNWLMTGGWTSENRRSGTFKAAHLPNGNSFSDDADTRRGDVGTIGRIRLDTNTTLTVRASITREWRTRWFGEERERDRRNGIFGDVAVTKTLGENLVTGGVAIDRDQYVALDTRDQSFRYTTPALYGEHTWTPRSWFGVTSSARLDLQSEFGDFVSPRVSVFLRPSDAWRIRVSRANGVYAPTPLTDETEGFGLSHVDFQKLEAEHALGWSVDVEGTSGPFELSASGYRTVVSHPLAIRIPPGSTDGLEILNADEPSRTQGIDVSARYRAGALRLTAAYAYLDATRPEIGSIVGIDFEIDTTMRRAVPYDPRHSGRLEATLERGTGALIGLEARFTGRQALVDSSVAASHPYVTVDARLEKHVGRAIVFARAMNLTGVQQSQFAPVLRRASGAAEQWADNVWAPLEGRVVSAGVRVLY